MAAGALLAAALIPMATATESGMDGVVAVSNDVALASSALDVLPAAADPFDIAGLLNAEIEAAQSLLTDIVGLPATLIDTTGNGIQAAIADLSDLNIGFAISDITSMLQADVNEVISVPFAVVNTLYAMAAVLPGEFLLNFGDLAP